MTDVVPPGWTIARIRDVAEINPRHPANLDPAMAVSFIPMPCVSDSKPDFDRVHERQLDEVRKGYTHFADGDVLFAKITPCMENGKGAVARALRNGIGCGTTELHVIRPTEAVDPYYLYHYLHQQRVRREAAANFTGSAGQLRVPVSFMAELRVPLPPLAEQRRILVALDAVLDKVAACQARLAKIPTILKRFRQAVLAAACSGRLTADWRAQHAVSMTSANGPAECGDVEPLTDAPEEWRWTMLNSLCDLQRGICYGVIKLGKPIVDGIPCLRTSDVRWLRIDETGVKRISPDISADFERSILRGAEVLVNVRGSLGGVAVVPARMRGWNVSREVAVVPVTRVVPEFVARWIASGISQAWLTGVTRGVAYTGINLEDLRLLPIAVPPLREQQQIVRRVDALFSVADQIEERFRKASAHVDKLTQAVLAKAFRGELVPTEAELARAEGREYEPASVLLERIRTKRSALNGAGERAERRTRRKTGRARRPE